MEIAFHFFVRGLQVSCHMGTGDRHVSKWLQTPAVTCPREKIKGSKTLNVKDGGKNWVFCFITPFLAAVSLGNWKPKAAMKNEQRTTLATNLNSKIPRPYRTNCVMTTNIISGGHEGQETCWILAGCSYHNNGSQQKRTNQRNTTKTIQNTWDWLQRTKTRLIVPKNKEVMDNSVLNSSNIGKTNAFMGFMNTNPLPVEGFGKLLCKCRTKKAHGIPGN